MKTVTKTLLTLAVLILWATVPLHANDLSSRSLDDVQAEFSFQRAKEAALWSQPVVGVAMTLNAIKESGGDVNDIVYLSQPSNWKWRILTPNSVSLYVSSVIRTSNDIPMVVAVPDVTTEKDIFGTIMDSFQVPLLDVGSRGADKGQGAKYLILPAKKDGPVPDGYIHVPTGRNFSYLMFRVIPSTLSSDGVAAARALLAQIKIYPFDSPEQVGKRIDVYDKLFDTVDPRDSTYFDYLADFLNQETILERDLMIMSMMQSFGYKHGEAFDPSSETRQMLSRAASSALDDLIVMTRDIAGEWWPGNPGWMQPIKAIGPMTQFKYLTESEYATDPRAETYSLYCCGPAQLGSATAYTYATRDVTGEPLEAQLSYRLHVPADVPVEQFWSLTAYDAQSAVFFEHVASVDISSLDAGLQYNPDGSIDLYTGPEPPRGKESNWIETNSKNNAVFLFRFYGPLPAAQDGTWIMKGFERMD